MADKKLSDVPVGTDFDYFIGVKNGVEIKMTKEQTAAVVGGQMQEATVSSKGLMSAKYRKRKWYILCPAIKTSAVKIARIKKSNGFFGANLRINTSMFQISSDILLAVYVTQSNYSFKCKHTTCAWDSATFDIIVSDAGTYYDVYVTGSFVTSYNHVDIEVSSTSDTVEPVEQYEAVSVSSIPVFSKFTIQ